jgi:CheY-like chemotaxis protein
MDFVSSNAASALLLHKQRHPPTSGRSVSPGNARGVGAVKSRHTILIVDDDPQFRELYSTALRFRGFNVTTASDGLSALRTIDQDIPSLIILDLNMPCVDGWTVLRELAAHEDTKAVPVIVVTGADVNRAALQSAAILRKPVLPEHVLSVIERQLHVA